MPGDHAALVQHSVFDNIYALGLWRGRSSAASSSRPSSGGGSTPDAARTTCMVLVEAARRVASARSDARLPVRILDAPCGDFTWMPACLTHIARELKVRVQYQGADIVTRLVGQLNDGKGSFLSNGRRSAIGEGVELREFLVLDAANTEAMAALRGRFDIMLTRHVTIHLQSEAILRIVDSWNAIGVRYVVTDDYPTSKNINWVDANATFPYREPNLREPPFSLPDPECSQPDASFCEAVASRCGSNINLFVPPLTHGAMEERRRKSARRGVYVHESNASIAMRRGRRLQFCVSVSESIRIAAAHQYSRPRARQLVRDFAPAWRRLYPPISST